MKIKFQDLVLLNSLVPNDHQMLNDNRKVLLHYDSKPLSKKCF